MLLVAPREGCTEPLGGWGGRVFTFGRRTALGPGEGRGEGGLAGQARGELYHGRGPDRGGLPAGGLATPAPWGGRDTGGGGAQCRAQWAGRGAQPARLQPRLWEDRLLRGCGRPGPQSRSPGSQEEGGPGCGCEALAGARLALLPGLGGPARLLLGAPGEVHPLLVHALGLHPLDEAEEVLVRHGGPARQPVGRRAALVVNPGGLGRAERVGGLARQAWRPRGQPGAGLPGAGARGRLWQQLRVWVSRAGRGAAGGPPEQTHPEGVWSGVPGTDRAGGPSGTPGRAGGGGRGG